MFFPPILQFCLNYAIFDELREKLRFEVNYAKSQHCRISEALLIKSFMGLPLKRHFCYKNYVNILITPKEFLPLTLEDSLTKPEEFHCSSTWRGGGGGGGYSNAIAHWQLAILRFNIRLGVSLRGWSMGTVEIVRCIVNALIN